MRIEERARPVVWHGGSKYALFVHEIGSEDADLAERVADIGGPPDPLHDPDLRGVMWEPVARLLDVEWCRKHFHQFAAEQAAAVRPHLARLHAWWTAKISVEGTEELAAQLTSISVSRTIPEPDAAPALASALAPARITYQVSHQKLWKHQKLWENMTNIERAKTGHINAKEYANAAENEIADLNASVCECIRSKSGQQQGWRCVCCDVNLNLGGLRGHFESKKHLRQIEVACDQSSVVGEE